MSFELFIAWRYLKAERKGLFAVVTTSIGVAGVTVGVAALITTLSVMNGFHADIQRRIVGAQAHLTVHGTGEEVEAALKKDPAVKAFAPFVIGQTIISRGQVDLGAVLKGIDPEREFQTSSLSGSLVEGGWRLGADGIVLGENLAQNLGAWVGQEVTLISPKSVATPLGLLPKMKKFKVVGILRTGYFEYDSATAWTALESAASFFNVKEGATGYSVRLERYEQSEEAARRLEDELAGAYRVRTFNELNRTLFAALALEKRVMFIILTLITLVASLNIASTLILRSVEKTRDIGLLKAMGAAPEQIKRVFLIEGFLIGATGVVAGLGLGLALCWIIQNVPLLELPADIYYITRVPVDVQPLDVAAVMVMGLVLSLLATLYPALRASRVNPVEAIHYG